MSRALVSFSSLLALRSDSHEVVAYVFVCVFGLGGSVDGIKGRPRQLTIYRACMESLVPGRGNILGG